MNEEEKGKQRCGGAAGAARVTPDDGNKNCDKEKIIIPVESANTHVHHLAAPPLAETKKRINWHRGEAERRARKNEGTEADLRSAN